MNNDEYLVAVVVKIGGELSGIISRTDLLGAYDKRIEPGEGSAREPGRCYCQK